MKISKICLWCNKEFQLFPSAIKQGKGSYCSKKCSGLAHNKKIYKICPICNNKFYVRRDRGIYCSVKCKQIAHSKFMAQKIPWNKGKKLHYKVWNTGTKGICKPNSGSFKKGRPGLRGPSHPCWKGGRLHPQGYKMVRMADHNKYIFEHRHVMEQHLGRVLKANEIIHHKNGIKDDNRIENLEIVLRTVHFGKIVCPHCLKEFLIK